VLVGSKWAQHSRSIVGKSQVGLWVSRVTARLTTWERGGRDKGLGGKESTEVDEVNVRFKLDRKSGETR
jgi:hypothetical protein